MKKDIHTRFTRLAILAAVLSTLIACGKARVTPASGTWRGDDLSFIVNDDGEVTDLSWTIRKEAGPYLNCPIKIPEKRMTIVDGMTEMAKEYDTDPPTWFNMQVVFNSETTAILSYDYNICPSTSISALDEKGDEVVYQGESLASWESP